ncbi:hypothetical protein ALC53_01402 [Atta colombica]|uniref:Uncharacterized protein n=1 Tax=Atta colombica TaxID=520822 RepID=A0A195BVG3_9HYME|nr:hypothetical protein ALC53_01402 [Atta colombica]
MAALSSAQRATGDHPLFGDVSGDRYGRGTEGIVGYGSRNATSHTFIKEDLKKRIIVGIHIAKQAIQKLAADSIRISPVLDFERKIIKLCKDLAKIRTDRDTLLKEIRSLRRKNREQWVSSHRRRDSPIIRIRDAFPSDSEEYMCCL